MKPKNVVVVPKKMSTKKMLLILLSPFWVPILIIIILFLVVKPISNFFDKQKFDTLHSEMHNLYDEIKASARDGDSWKYAHVCDHNIAGILHDGTSHCVVSISLKKITANANELKEIHDLYYPIINSSDKLKSSNELTIYYPDYFGKQFVVSAAEKEYLENKTKITCVYNISLRQYIDGSIQDDNLGTAIKGDKAWVTFNLRCVETAYDNWYPESKTAFSSIPEEPTK